ESVASHYKPWLHSLDGTTCAGPLKGRFKGAFFAAPVSQKPCGKGDWQPKGTSPVILPMDAGITRAKPSRAEKAAMVRGMREPGFSLAVNDPQPMPEVARFWRTAAQSATIGMFIILLVVALSLARPVLLPVASAFVVTMMLGPLSARAERHKIPS